MITKRWKRGVTLLEIVVVIIILVILIALLLPAVQIASEARPKVACKSNMSQLGRAILLFEEMKGSLPRSHYKPADSTVWPEVLNSRSRGWSWACKITPFMERRDLYEKIDFKDSTSNPDRKTENVRYVAAGIIPILWCPVSTADKLVEHSSGGNRPEAVDDADPERCLLSSYKVVSASRMDSLAAAYGSPAPADYGVTHPDGAIHPKTDYPIDAISDGASNTILIAESSEKAHSRWIFGNEMEMIGLPETIKLVRDKEERFAFDFPQGFGPADPKWYKESEIDPGTNGSGQPFAAWEYTGNNAEPSYQGKQWNNPNAWLGPSSDHVDVVNHLFADCSVSSIRKDVDAAAYYFMITRCNDDIPAKNK